ncbi:MAG: hypothetical protein AAFR05_08305, partial [Bacteroidota bacterium]
HPDRNRDSVLAPRRDVNDRSLANKNILRWLLGILLTRLKVFGLLPQVTFDGPTPRRLRRRLVAVVVWVFFIWEEDGHLKQHQQKTKHARFHFQDIAGSGIELSGKAALDGNEIGEKLTPPPLAFKLRKAQLAKAMGLAVHYADHLPP